MQWFVYDKATQRADRPLTLLEAMRAVRLANDHASAWQGDGNRYRLASEVDLATLPCKHAKA